jgi:ABC-2 type transport system ATP-binding protein
LKEVRDLDKPPIIEAANLTKKYGDLLAVDHISFQIFKGELFGFLGPNGAGKTSTIRILTGLARATDGSVNVAGIDISRNPKKAQHLIGVVPDESNLYPELTGFDNLVFCASLYGLRKPEAIIRAEELLKTFNLVEAGHRKFGGYSRGMKRKLTIAAGIIHHPQILFLDEPTTGLDVASARQIRQLIADLHQAGITIFLTTHYIEEAERLCERIAFIVKGKLIRVDTVSNLLQPIKNENILMISMSKIPDGIIESIISEFPDYRVETCGDSQLKFHAKQSIPVGPLIASLEKRGAEVMEAQRVHPSLEEIFVRITGLDLDKMDNGDQKKASIK